MVVGYGVCSPLTNDAGIDAEPTNDVSFTALNEFDLLLYGSTVSSLSQPCNYSLTCAMKMCQHLRIDREEPGIRN